MALFFKKHRSKTAKFAGIILFTLLMFVNLQITTNPNKNGDIDLFGLKLSLAIPSVVAYSHSGGCYFCNGENCASASGSGWDVCDDSNGCILGGNSCSSK